MINVPKELMNQFDIFLHKKTIPEKQHYYYKKWLRYYLDFCHKYRYRHSERQSLSHFLKKLQKKIKLKTNKSKPRRLFFFIMNVSNPIQAKGKYQQLRIIKNHLQKSCHQC